jgi:hypothetical protein
MAVWSIGDIITTYDRYISNGLTSTLDTTVLRSLSGTRLTVVNTGSIFGMGATRYYITVRPEGGSKDLVLHFDSDEERDRAFREAQSPGNYGQTGRYTPSPESTPTLDSEGVFTSINQAITGGTTSRTVDNIGATVELISGSSVGDEAYWATADDGTDTKMCRLNNNPYMELTFLFNSLGNPRFFAGIAAGNSDPNTNILVSSPTVGIAGLWFEAGTDTNFQFVSNGTGGTLTKTDTGVAPNEDTLYLLETLVSGNGASSSKKVNFWLRDLGTFTAGKSGRILATANFSGTDLMEGDANLMFLNGCVVATGTTETRIRTYGGLIELNS